MSQPLVSIIVPNYNHAAFLAETLDSILSQDYPSIEVLVGDDASTDASREVIESFGNKIRAFFFEKNRGYFAVVADLFKEVEGKYVHIFSSDDLYMNGFLSTSIALMERERLNLCCTDIRYFSPTSDRVTKLYETESPSAFGPSQIISVFRESDFWVPGVSCIAKAETLRKYGLPRKQLENISDWFLFHHMALFEGVGYVPRVGVSMREQESSYTSKVKRDRYRRNQTYWEVLRIVKQDRVLRQKFRDSTLLSFIFDNLFWKLILRPQWWDFFVAHRNKSPWGSRLRRSILKRLRKVWN